MLQINSTRWSLLLLFYPRVNHNKPEFSKKTANLKFPFLKVYFSLSSFTIFKTHHMALYKIKVNAPVSKSIFERLCFEV